MTRKQNVEVIIRLQYTDQESKPVNGSMQPSRDRVHRDLYDKLKNGERFSYEERRTTIE